MDTGTAIKLMRQALGIRQVDLARSAGISTAFYCLVEKGERKASLETLQKIARAMGISSQVIVLLAMPESGLRTNDRAATSLAGLVREMGNVEDRLRRRLQEGRKNESR